MTRTDSNAKLRRLSWILLLLPVVLGLMFAVFFVHSPPEALLEFQNRFNEARVPLAMWRAFLFIVLIGGWPLWVTKLGCHLKLKAWQIDTLNAYRWRMAVWLLILEAVLVQNIPATFFRLCCGGD